MHRENSNMIWERCCTCREDAFEAAAGRASRIELCERLEVGGVTPSERNISLSMEAGLPVNVLVRPRGGNFVFSKGEIDQMLESIRLCGRHRVNGVVIGALTADGNVDVPVMRLLASEAAEAGLQVTFHRAFDECRDPFEALEDIIRLGCSRILTSGHATAAPEGAVVIKELVGQAGDRIIVMPGSGVTPDNVRMLAEVTGASEFHGTKLY